uniref:Uncharacterized protein LOC101512419 n=1 Tax=Cicer arietinum TaxID=3827 RepID=A0A1S2YA66_CICAR|nr:uncharacterized protein LOC101512419 [Cicer arietinum]
MRSSSCCLGINRTTTKPSLVPTKPPQVSLVEKNKGCWRSRCVVIGVASCFNIIGLQINNSFTFGHQPVFKEEIMFVAMSNSFHDDVFNNSSSTLLLVRGAKWSEKRMCPSWQGNNPLETVVPENLPRPATRRRYEAVSSTSKTAPPLSLSLKLKSNKDNCFSM